jgi:hypothetical protein
MNPKELEKFNARQLARGQQPYVPQQNPVQ